MRVTDRCLVEVRVVGNLTDLPYPGWVILTRWGNFIQILLPYPAGITLPKLARTTKAG